MNTSPDVLFLVDDDNAYPQISELTHLGFQVNRFTALSDLYLYLSQHNAALVVLACSQALLDIAAAKLRGMRPTIGIVALAHFPDGDARVRTLLSGADACLEKNISGLELAAVFQSLIRRIGDTPQAPSRTELITPTPTIVPEPSLAPQEAATSAAGAWRLTSKGWALMAPTGQTLSLTTAERNLVLRFAQAADKRLSREALSLAMTPDDGVESERRGRFVDVMISRMRRKAAAVRARLPIKAVHGWGYMFACDLIVDPDTPELDTLPSNVTPLASVKPVVQDSK